MFTFTISLPKTKFLNEILFVFADWYITYMCACICITKEEEWDAGWLDDCKAQGLFCYEDKQESEGIYILVRDIFLSDGNDLDRRVSEMSETGRW
jgi:hypothetical protein